MFTADLYLVNNNRQFDSFDKALDWAQSSGFRWRILDADNKIVAQG